MVYYCSSILKYSFQPFICINTALCWEIWEEDQGWGGGVEVGVIWTCVQNSRCRSVKWAFAQLLFNWIRIKNILQSSIMYAYILHSHTVMVKVIPWLAYTGTDGLQRYRSETIASSVLEGMCVLYQAPANWPWKDSVLLVYDAGWAS